MASIRAQVPKWAEPFQRRAASSVVTDAGIMAAPGVRVPVLFCDLDGTLRHHKADAEPPSERGFINAPDDVAIFDGVGKRLRRFCESGWVCVAHSNQGGVAFGHLSVADAQAILDETLRQIQAQANVSPAAISTLGLHSWPFVRTQMAFGHPEGTEPVFRYRSLMRKPNTGALAMTEAQLQKSLRVVVDWDRSLVIGDRPEDEEMARAARVPFMRADWWREGRADYAADDLCSHYNSDGRDECLACGADVSGLAYAVNHNENRIA